MRQEAFLPTNLPNPGYRFTARPNPGFDAPIITLALTSETMALSQVEDYADTRFAQKISQLPGVGLVSISGGQKPAVRIQANPTALASPITSISKICARRSMNANVEPGQRQFFDRSEKLPHTIGANDQLLKSEDYKPRG